MNVLQLLRKIAQTNRKYVPDIIHHTHHFNVGAAMLGSLKRRKRCSNNRIGIRTGRSYHTGGKGGVISAAVLHVKNQGRIQNPCFQIRVLRILFDEKKRELSVSDEVIVNLGDIQDKFLSLKIRDKMIDKTTMGNALRLFRRYQLIELLESDLKNEESRVLIYNSILMAVRVEDIKSVYEKVDSYRKGKLKDEEADQTETD